MAIVGANQNHTEIAALLLSIDEDLSAEILKSLKDTSIDKVTRAMKEVQEMSADGGIVLRAYEQAYRRIRAQRMSPGRITGDVESVLIKAFGESKGGEVGTRSSANILVRKPFAVFESLPADDLALLLVEEHPQIAAVFLAHLDRTKAADVFKHLPPEGHADLLLRVATLDRTPPDVVQGVLDVLSKKVADLGLTTLRSEPKGWIKAAAEILNNMGGGDKEILDAIGETEEDIAKAIREEMFTFDDLVKLARRAMQKVLTEVDTRALALSLKAASQDVEDAIFSNLSKRAAAMVGEERDSLGPTPLSDVLEAQNEILNVVRDLIDKGDVTIGSGEGDRLV